MRVTQWYIIINLFDSRWSEVPAMPFLVSLDAAVVESQPYFNFKMCLVNRKEKQTFDHITKETNKHI